MRQTIISLALSAVAFSASAPTAQAQTADADSVEDAPHQVALTISPLHLIIPMFELTGEYAVTNRLGLAGVLGLASVRSTSAGVTESALVFELGAQARYYLVGNFNHGMQLGAELMYVGGSSGGSASGVGSTAGGILVGPFVGYKIAAKFGLTFEIQGGVEYLTVTGSSAGGNATISGLIPLVNINLGWSF